MKIYILEKNNYSQGFRENDIIAIFTKKPNKEVLKKLDLFSEKEINSLLGKKAEFSRDDNIEFSISIYKSED